MALGRRARGANKAIKAALIRARFLRANGFPASLKVAFFGGPKRGGAALRLERLRRKLPGQQKGVKRTRHLRPLIP